MRVNGEAFGSYKKRTVCLLGKVKEVDASMCSFRLEACDGVTINVILMEKLSERLQLKSYVEVIGDVTSMDSILCKRFTPIPMELTANFDMALYNQFVTVALKNPELAATMDLTVPDD